MPVSISTVAIRGVQETLLRFGHVTGDMFKEAAQAATQAGEPQDGQPPEEIGEQAVAGLELDGGECRQIKHVESLRDSGEWCNSVESAR